MLLEMRRMILDPVRRHEEPSEGSQTEWINALDGVGHGGCGVRLGVAPLFYAMRLFYGSCALFRLELGGLDAKPVHAGTGCANVRVAVCGRQSVDEVSSNQ
jgi:hypothetical protein